MKIKCFLLIIITLIIFTPFLLLGDEDFIGFGEIKEKDWGGIEKDWPSISIMQNVIKIRGPGGMLGIRLSDNTPVANNNTELLLHFDSVKFGRLLVDGSSYLFQYADVFPSLKIKVMGNGACAFQHIGSKIDLSPRELALLYPGKKFDSFCIDFYLNPTIMFNGETIISMMAPSMEYNGKFTGFKAFFKDGKMVWSFNNIFSGRKGEFKKISISELDPSPLYEWHHHTFYFDSKSGMMILYVDGKESSIKWITNNGKEDGTILDGKLPNSLTVPLTIGGSFIGYMDEFMISRGKKNIIEGKYKKSGKLISNVIHFNSRVVNIAKLKWESIENKGTAVRIMYRISDNYFLPNDNGLKKGQNSSEILNQNNLIRLKNEPQWKIAKNGRIIKEKGRYFQWKARFYGTNNIYTPILKKLQLFYEEDLPPSKPILLNATPGNGSVKLRWVANKEKDISGYKLYYGYSSHSYFGKGANLGNSPIILGNITSVTIKGLNNNKVYFFSITALDKSGQESSFSREFATRPSIIYSN